MASTVSTASLKILIQEDITLNNKVMGGKTVHTISSINEVSERILTVPTHQVPILALSSSAGAGTYITNKVRYIRLTNLDDENFVRLTFRSGSLGTSSTNAYDVKLEAKRTLMFTSVALSGSATGASFGSFSNFTSLDATANSSACEVELFVATV
jgi:hypothetical protein